MASMRSREKKKKKKIYEKKQASQFKHMTDQGLRRSNRVIPKKKSKTNIDHHDDFEQEKPDQFFRCSLLEDLLLEIFFRFPNRQSIIQYCSTICKHWFSLVFSSRFVLSFNRFRYDRNYPTFSYFDIIISTTSTNNLFSIKGSNRSKITCTTSNSDLNFLEDHAVIRASFNEFFLISCKVDLGVDYYLCNTFTRECSKLPQRRWHSSGFGLVCEPYKELGSNTQHKYTVVLIHTSEFCKYKRTYDFTASIYCSETNNWYLSKASLRHNLKMKYECSSNRRPIHDIVTSNGLLFWLGGHTKIRGVIACDPFSCTKLKQTNTMRAYFIDLPGGFSRSWRPGPSEGKVCLGVVQGQLRLLQLIHVNQNCFGLKVWELTDYGGEDDIAPSAKSWLLVHEVKLKGVKQIFVLAFHPNNDNAIFVVRDHNVFLYKIEEREYETIGEFPYNDFDNNEKERGGRNVFTIMQPS